MPTPSITIQPITPTIGAEVTGVDLRDCDASTIEAISSALQEHQVLFFRDQELSPEHHLRFASSFGAIEPPAFRTPGMEHPDVLVIDISEPRGVGTDHWHADATHRAAPPIGSILCADTLPTSGGDTCFASMYAAYESLSPALQSFVDPLRAEHTDAMVAAMTARQPGVSANEPTDGAACSIHPVVRVHPETQRKLLNVNGNWTSRIVELTETESRAILDLLFATVTSPDIQCRFRWTPGAVAFWDNRAVQHYAVADYSERRVMQRVTVVGEPPFGPSDHQTERLLVQPERSSVTR